MWNTLFSALYYWYPEIHWTMTNPVRVEWASLGVKFSQNRFFPFTILESKTLFTKKKYFATLTKQVLVCERTFKKAFNSFHSRIYASVKISHMLENSPSPLFEYIYRFWFQTRPLGLECLPCDSYSTCQYLRDIAN